MCLRRVVIRIVASLAASLPHAAVFAAAEPGDFQFSLVGGQIGLFGDPGQGGANAFGIGVGVGYRFDNEMGFGARYLKSNHPEVEHTDLSVGFDYFLNNYEKANPHFQAGMSFLGNSFKNVNLNGSAVGVYVGGGIEFELSNKISVGPELRFLKSFGAKGTANNQTIDTVSDGYSLLLKLSYTPKLED